MLASSSSSFFALFDASFSSFSGSLFSSQPPVFLRAIAIQAGWPPVLPAGSSGFLGSNLGADLRTGSFFWFWLLLLLCRGIARRGGRGRNFLR